MRKVPMTLTIKNRLAFIDLLRGTKFYVHFRFRVLVCKSEEAGILPDLRICILETTRKNRIDMDHWLFSPSAFFFLPPNDH